MEHARKPKANKSQQSKSPQSPTPQPDGSQNVLELQRVIGNQAVSKMLTANKPALMPNANGTAVIPHIQRDFLDDVADTVGSAADSVGSAVSSAADSVSSAVSSVGEAIGDTVGSAVNEAKEWATGGGDAKGDDSDSGMSLFEGKRDALIAEIKGMLDEKLSGARAFAEGAMSQLGDLPSLPGSMEDMVKQFTEGLPGTTEDAPGALEGLWAELKMGSARLEQMAGVVEALEAELNTMQTQVETIIIVIRKTVEEAIDGIIGGVVSLFKSLAGEVNKLKIWLNKLIDDTIKGIVSGFKAVMAAITALKPYLSKPWFWLSIIFPWYKEVARRAFKAAYSHYLPKRFIDQYIDMAGPLKLNPTEMADSAVEPDITESKAFMKTIDDLKKAGGGKQHVKVSGHGVAATHGTMGNFTINYEGDVAVTVDASGDAAWDFNGQMNFFDIWDFDSKPFATSHRGFWAEVLTTIGDWFLPGKGFDINSDTVPVTQSSADAQGVWAGSGVVGTPSRLFAEGEGEKKEGSQ